MAKFSFRKSRTALQLFTITTNNTYNILQEYGVQETNIKGLELKSNVSQKWIIISMVQWSAKISL